jgi:nitroimidazol reductase NimA-like FMN-containing flavoprotein (pyridoxamine 5'-phosphate oxidase superfamily)
MRRKDREMPREFAEAVIDASRFATLATVDSDGTPYCVALSMVRDRERLYFHCALEGHKIENLRRESRVCISFVGETKLPSDDFTVEYESAVVFGAASEVINRDEKIRALRLICERCTPSNMAAFDAAIEKSLDLTGVWKIHIGAISGKRNKPEKRRAQAII